MNKNIIVENININLLKKQREVLLNKFEAGKNEQIDGIINMFDKMIEKADDGFFVIPSMVVSRDDILSMYEGRDDFEEKQKQIAKISDEDMQNIVDDMTDNIMDDYWGVLEVIYDNYLERKQNGDD
jgi:hypothetical protein